MCIVQCVKRNASCRLHFLEHCLTYIVVLCVRLQIVDRFGNALATVTSPANDLILFLENQPHMRFIFFFCIYLLYSNRQQHFPKIQMDSMICCGLMRSNAALPNHIIYEWDNRFICIAYRQIVDDGWWHVIQLLNTIELHQDQSIMHYPLTK